MRRRLDGPVSRRRFLRSGMLLGAGALALASAGCDPAIVRRLRQTESRRFPRHGVWVWQFSIDGPAEEIAQVLGSYGLAAIVKTHDGIEWMARYDDVPGAIDGPGQVATVAGIFEAAGVPFHAWAVVKGIDPVREAEMAASVLAAGARSLTLDLEDHEGFWVGSAADAVRFGQELRARDEFARVDISIDPRPWKIGKVPIQEFVAFTDGIRPQLYWELFDDDDHVNAYEYMGFSPGAEGITPRFVLETTHALLAPFDRWIIPVTSGAAEVASDLPGFARRAWELGMYELSLWRYELTTRETLSYISANPPGIEPAWG